MPDKDGTPTPVETRIMVARLDEAIRGETGLITQVKLLTVKVETAMSRMMPLEARMDRTESRSIDNRNRINTLSKIYGGIVAAIIAAIGFLQWWKNT